MKVPLREGSNFAEGSLSTERNTYCRPAADAKVERQSRITAEHKVGWIVQWHPATLPLLIAKGFAPLQNPILRRTMAWAVSLRTVARQHNLDEEALVAELNSVAGFGRDGDDSRQMRQLHQDDIAATNDISLPVV